MSSEKKQDTVVVYENEESLFEKKSNDLHADGYVLRSCYCGCMPTDDNGFVRCYQGIFELVEEEAKSYA